MGGIIYLYGIPAQFAHLAFKQYIVNMAFFLPTIVAVVPFSKVLLPKLKQC
jgi:hypothetical protein